MSPSLPKRSFIIWSTAFLPVPVTDWYVLTTMRFILKASCSLWRAKTIWMVEQFGLAMILSSLESSFALISGTTSFLVGSMRQAEELSTTNVPTSANFGAISLEMLPPAEKMAIAGLAAIASAMETTL